MDEIQGLKKTSLSLLRLVFTKDDINLAGEIARYFHNRINGLEHADEASEQIIELVKEKGYTKGHWFMGV